MVEQPAAQLDPIQATVAHQNEPLPAIERSPRIVPHHPRPARSTADEKNWVAAFWANAWNRS
ncbi:MAG: hypothetical protein V9G98_00030 [Candidatus Competibacter sp.]